MGQEWLYEERLSSRRTTALFVMLTAIFAALYLWRRSVGDSGALTGVLGFLCGTFAFYVLNYATLIIRLGRELLVLTFGLLRWVVPLCNVQGIGHDELPALLRNGGAGIHFMSVRGRYRASFNFLEHPRVVVELKQPAGPVRDISFSTRQPDDVVRMVRGALTDL